MTSESTNAISTSNVAAVAKPYRLQYEKVQDSWVLLYPEGMLKLNGPAGEILKRCDGVRDISGVISELETAFEQSGLSKDVMAFFELALEKRWVTIGPANG